MKKQMERNDFSCIKHIGTKAKWRYWWEENQIIVRTSGETENQTKKNNKTKIKIEILSVVENVWKQQ